MDRFIYNIGDNIIREIYRVYKRRFRVVLGIQNQYMKAKMQILEITRDMEVDELLLQDFADGWAKPNCFRRASEALPS